MSHFRNLRGTNKINKLSNEERITTSFEELNSVVFSGSFSTPPKINFLAINPLNDGGVENDSVILRTQDDGVII